MKNPENKKHIVTAEITEEAVISINAGIGDFEGEARSEELSRRMRETLGDRAFFAATLSGDQPYAVVTGVDEEGNEVTRLTPLNHDFGTTVGTGARSRFDLPDPEAALNTFRSEQAEKLAAREKEKALFEATQPVMTLLGDIDSIARRGGSREVDNRIGAFVQYDWKSNNFAKLPSRTQKAMEYMAIGGFNNGDDAISLCEQVVNNDSDLTDEEKQMIRGMIGEAANRRTVPGMSDQAVDSLLRTARTPSDRMSEKARQRVEALALGLAASTRSMQTGYIAESFKKRLRESVMVDMGL